MKIKGNNMKNPFKYNLNDELELANRIGQERFSSPCKHEKTKNGHCLKCLRRVYTTKDLKRA